MGSAEYFRISRVLRKEALDILRFWDTQERSTRYSGILVRRRGGDVAWLPPKAAGKKDH